MRIQDFGGLLKRSFNDWLDDKASRLGAALAYYTIFSLAPLLLVTISLAGLIFGQEAAQRQIVGQLQGLVGAEGKNAIESMLAHASKPGAGITSSILGLLMLLAGAAGLFGQLQDALNTIWGVQPKPGRGVWGFIQDRFLSFTMVLGVAFLLLVSLVISATLSALVHLLGAWQTGVVGFVMNETVSLGIITLLFAMIFRYLPDAQIVWRDVWLGSALTALLFEVGKFLIGLYLGSTNVASGYGAAGSLAVLLVWLYYSGQIFLFGAEFTKVYANQFGSRIVPTGNAVRVTSEERAEQGLTPREIGKGTERPQSSVH